MPTTTGPDAEARTGRGRQAVAGLRRPRAATEAADADAPSSTVGQLLSALPGLIATAFVGFLNVLGLQDDQVQTILRTGSVKATFVVVLLAASLLLAIASILVTSRVRGLYVLGAGLTAAFLAFLVPVVVPPPESALTDDESILDSAWGQTIAWVGMFASGALALVVLGLAARHTLAEWRNPEVDAAPHPRGRRFKAQSVMIVASLLLAFLAFFAALRLEASASATQGSPQVGFQWQQAEDGTGFAEVSVAAFHLLLSDQIKITVAGLPRSAENLRTCFTDTSTGIHSPWCTVVFGAVFRPDSNGNITQTVRVPIDADGVAQLEIVGNLCKGDNPQCARPSLNRNPAYLLAAVPRRAATTTTATPAAGPATFGAEEAAAVRPAAPSIGCPSGHGR